jgi:hypothetical protein
MCPTSDDHESREAAASRFYPADRFDFPGSTRFAIRAADLRAQQQRSQQLNEYCDETVAAIRASLERTSSG